MKFMDHICAWALFVIAIAGILMIETRQPVGAVLDTPFLWILVAMFNLLRLRNGYRVRGLKTFCIGANLIALVTEIVRFKMFGLFNLIQVVPILAETVFSMVGNNIVESNDAPHS